MVGIDGNPLSTANSSSTDLQSSASQTCNYKCSVITLSVAIPGLSLLIIGILAFGLRQRRRDIRKKMERDEETRIAMSKLEPESETSSVIEDIGDVSAVTNPEDGAETRKEPEKALDSRRPKSLGLKTIGWWRL